MGESHDRRLGWAEDTGHRLSRSHKEQTVYRTDKRPCGRRVQRGSSPWCEEDATGSSSTFVSDGPRSQEENLATVEFGNAFKLACNTEVTYPTAQISSAVGQAAFHGDSTTAAGEFLDAALEGDKFLGCYLDRHPLIVAVLWTRFVLND